jgi:hypothetical protein
MAEIKYRQLKIKIIINYMNVKNQKQNLSVHISYNDTYRI